MITIVVVFVSSFLIVAAVMVVILWTMSVNAELKAWKERQRQRIRLSENNAAWERNREMIVY